jgi:hypothetical protein
MWAEKGGELKMHSTLNSMSRTAIALLVAIATSTIMVSTAVSAQPQALLIGGSLVA